jgi:hypothetical protein
MALEDLTDDYLTPEVGIAAAALLLTPPTRRLLRRGATYGLAGAFAAGDAVAALARAATRALRPAHNASDLDQHLAAEARRERARRLEDAPAQELPDQPSTTGDGAARA